MAIRVFDEFTDAGATIEEAHWLAWAGQNGLSLVKALFAKVVNSQEFPHVDMATPRSKVSAYGLVEFW